jgi:MOSC domain-containing protein YiiM
VVKVVIIKKDKQQNTEARIISINISHKKGCSKQPVEKAFLEKDLGIVDDAHASPGDRQVSLLAMESIEKQKRMAEAKVIDLQLKPGDFAENITTEGLDLMALNIGDKLKIGSEVWLEVTKIGKECVKPCSIYYTFGKCIMPLEGIFVAVKASGEIKVMDKIEVVKK